MKLFPTMKHLISAVIFFSILFHLKQGFSLETIRIAGITNIPPLEYESPFSGTQGLYVELWKLWSEKTGIKIVYTAMDKKSAFHALQEGSIDAVMGVHPSLFTGNDFLFTDYIITRDVYIYHNRKINSAEKLKDLVPYRTGITADDLLHLGSEGEGIDFVVRGNVAELFQESERGGINVFLADSVYASHELGRMGKWKNYFQSSDPVIRAGVAAAVRSGREDLKDKIDRGFLLITGTEKFIMKKTWSGGNIQYRMPWGYVVTVGVIFSLLFMVILVWIWNFQLKRTVDRTTLELRKMKEEAEAASEAKSRFLDNISHELRTPLTLILAPLEEALAGKHPGNEIYEMMIRNSRNLLALINNLLDLSRAKSGGMRLKVIETDLSSFVKKFSSDMNSAALGRGIVISNHLPGEPLAVFIDAELFSRVMWNFFSNSFKFTASGGSIEILLEKRADTAYLRFRDSGRGILRERIDFVFDRFITSDDSHKSFKEGSGIGLAIVKEIVELHGGIVTVKSRHESEFPLEHGTEFTVAIPLGKKHLEGKSYVEFADAVDDFCFTLPDDIYTAGHVMPDEDILPSVDTGDERPSILIVEDNRDMRNYLSRLLRDDYDVLTAADGRVALQILDRHPETDLIISDVMMPEMDGYAFLEALRSDERFQGVPLLFLSARGDKLVQLKGLELGAVDYLVKPFNPGELLLRIKNQMELKTIRNRLIRKNRELYEKLREPLTSDQEKPLISGEMQERMERVCDFIKENFREEISREMISETIGMNPDTFSRVFNQFTGKGLSDYTNEFRVEEAKRLLLESDITVTRISIDTGFDNLRTFNRSFRKITGMSPIEYRNSKKV